MSEFISYIVECGLIGAAFGAVVTFALWTLTVVSAVAGGWAVLIVAAAWLGVLAGVAYRLLDRKV